MYAVGVNAVGLTTRRPQVQILSPLRQKRPEILADFLPAMEAHGHDTGAVKAVSSNWVALIGALLRAAGGISHMVG
jgi:hypothetical protein